MPVLSLFDCRQRRNGRDLQSARDGEELVASRDGEKRPNSSKLSG
jgi:hypothetical protein